MKRDYEQLGVECSNISEWLQAELNPPNIIDGLNNTIFFPTRHLAHIWTVAPFVFIMSKYQFHRAVVEDADAIFKLINEAYAVEHGDEGVAFKNCPRLDEPLEQFMLDAYEQNRIIKAIDESGNIVGMLSYEITPDYVYFGPFAVCPSVKGNGLGKLLMKELHDIAYESGVHCIEMNVVNWRSDLIPMYEKMGFEKIREEPFPEPQKATRPSLLLVYRKTLAV